MEKGENKSSNKIMELNKDTPGDSTNQFITSNETGRKMNYGQ